MWLCRVSSSSEICRAWTASRALRIPGLSLGSLPPDYPQSWLPSCVWQQGAAFRAVAGHRIVGQHSIFISSLAIVHFYIYSLKSIPNCLLTWSLHSVALMGHIGHPFHWSLLPHAADSPCLPSGLKVSLGQNTRSLWAPEFCANPG